MKPDQTRTSECLFIDLRGHLWWCRMWLAPNNAFQARERIFRPHPHKARATSCAMVGIVHGPAGNACDRTRNRDKYEGVELST